jgi:hypothetical protein
MENDHLNYGSKDGNILLKRDFGWLINFWFLWNVSQPTEFLYKKEREQNKQKILYRPELFNFNLKGKCGKIFYKKKKKSLK